MKTYQHIVLIFLASWGLTAGSHNPENSVPHAKQRIHNDFIQKLYGDIWSTQSLNQANMMQIFTQGTLEQEQEVAKYVQAIVNQTKSEANTLRMASNTSMEITNCLYHTELSVLQVFLTTYENFDNCVKSTQKAFLKLYNDINTKLDNLKREIVTYYQHSLRSLSNCVDESCVVKTLIPCVMKYEMSREHLSNEIKAHNDLNVNYLVKNIAMKCVTSSMGQIHHNHNIAKQMMTACFSKQPQTNPTN